MQNVSLFDDPDAEDVLISSLSEDHYHRLCSGYPIAQVRCFRVSTQHPVGPGIFRSDPQYRTCVRITEPLVLAEEELCWSHYGGAPGELLPNSWVRYASGRTCTLKFEIQLVYLLHDAWLAQANRIFTELQEVTSCLEDYVSVDEVRFILQCLPTANHYNPADPEGYLFVCPFQDFCSGIEPNLYQWPDCPAYWSLDPSGATRLSTEDAEILGFPAIHIETIVAGKSWSRSVYKGLRRFHEGKGLDPDGREVARQLGYPPYEVLSALDSSVPFPAHSVKQWWCEADDLALCRSLGHYLE
ncbi:hypothetical protein C8R45DRAFT_501782 [Mycena sanguinolenta]|nr:hypothetical protein C8R45DRAFT_501782 [Mycena sanguinolenta]